MAHELVSSGRLRNIKWLKWKCNDNNDARYSAICHHKQWLVWNVCEFVLIQWFYMPLCLQTKCTFATRTTNENLPFGNIILSSNETTSPFRSFANSRLESLERTSLNAKYQTVFWVCWVHGRATNAFSVHYFVICIAKRSPLDMPQY